MDKFILQTNDNKYTLKALRTNKGLTLNQASKNLGVSQQTLSNWECGKSYPTVPRVKMIEKIYDISFNEINFLL